MPDNPSLSSRAALMLLVIVIVLWGTNWPVMKVGLEYISPLLFTGMRMLLGCVCMIAMAWVTGYLRMPRAGEWSLILGVGLVQMAMFLGLVTIALQFVPAGRSSILAYTTSLWVVPLAAMTLGERLNRQRLAGFVLGIGGVVVLFNPFGFDWSDPYVVMGNGLLLLAAFCWALLIVFVRARNQQGPPLALAPWQFAVASAVLVPVAVVTEDVGQVAWGNPTLLAILFYNGPIATAFAFWAIISVTRTLPAVTTSIGSLGVPAFGLTASTLVLGEQLTGTNVAGLLLIAAGVAMVTLSEKHGGGEPVAAAAVSDHEEQA